MSDSVAAVPAEPVVKRGRPPGAKTRPKTDADPAQLRSIAAAWLGLWIVLGILGKLIGWLAGYTVQMDELTTREAEADAVALVPLVERYPASMRLMSWIGAPIVIVRRVSEKLHLTRKTGAKQPPKAVPPEEKGTPDAA